MKKELVKLCKGCSKQGGSLPNGVFTSVEVVNGKKQRVYSCGLGENDCMNAYLAQRLNDYFQRLESLEQSGTELRQDYDSEHRRFNG